jgi:hypothetical protein
MAVQAAQIPFVWWKNGVQGSASERTEQVTFNDVLTEFNT